MGNPETDLNIEIIGNTKKSDVSDLITDAISHIIDSLDIQDQRDLISLEMKIVRSLAKLIRDYHEYPVFFSDSEVFADFFKTYAPRENEEQEDGK